MSSIEHSFQEFIDAIQTAHGDDDFERVATRVTQRLGFRWFAYLRIVEDAPKLISSYPKSWTNRYFDLRYQLLDPVIRRARLEHGLFSWGSGASTPAGTREQRRFLEEATTFGIESGITVRAGRSDRHVRTFRATRGLDDPLRSILRSISSAHSSPSLRRRNVSAT